MKMEMQVLNNCTFLCTGLSSNYFFLVPISFLPKCSSSNCTSGLSTCTARLRECSSLRRSARKHLTTWSSCWGSWWTRATRAAGTCMSVAALSWTSWWTSVGEAEIPAWQGWGMLPKQLFELMKKKTKTQQNIFMAFWVKDDPCSLPVWRVVCDMEPTLLLPERLRDERLEASSMLHEAPGMELVLWNILGKTFQGAFLRRGPCYFLLIFYPLLSTALWLCQHLLFGVLSLVLFKRKENGKGPSSPIDCWAEGINSESQHFLPFRFVRQFWGKRWTVMNGWWNRNVKRETFRKPETSSFVIAGEWGGTEENGPFAQRDQWPWEHWKGNWANSQMVHVIFTVSR